MALINLSKFANKMVSIIYVAIGSACNSREIFERNNQQFPPFLVPIAKQLSIEEIEIILVDPCLDLITVPDVKEIGTVDNVRYLEGNHDGIKLVVKAMKKNWSWPFDREIDDGDVAFLSDLAESCIYGPNKMIVMDYSGRNIKPLFYHFVEQYDFASVIKNICVDPGNDQGCYVDFSQFDIQVNEHDFVQEQFLPLSQMRNIQTCLKERIDLVNYPTTKVLHDLMNGQKVDVINVHDMIKLARIYLYPLFNFRTMGNHSVDTQSENDIEYVSGLMYWLEQLAIKVLTDVCRAKGIEFPKEKMRLIHQNKRSEFQNWTCSLKR